MKKIFYIILTILMLSASNVEARGYHGHHGHHGAEWLAVPVAMVVGAAIAKSVQPEPVYVQPAYAQPVYTAPVAPVYTYPVFQQPVYQQPVEVRSTYINPYTGSRTTVVTVPY